MDLSEIKRAVAAGLEPLRVEIPLRCSEWAERHFYLSGESSYVEMQWHAYPFQQAILDCMGHDGIPSVNLRKSARVGYTKMLLATIGYFAEHKRRNQAVWQPTDDDSDDFCKTELEPMLRDVKIMRRIFPEFLAKNKSNTLRQKQFLGCMLHLRGGKAAKNYRRLSLDVACLDELDGYDSNIEKEGSPVKLAEKRLEGATFPKLITGSTPGMKGTSMVGPREDQAELRFEFHVPCPHCEAYHPLKWGGRDADHGMKWADRDPETIAQLCPCCGALYTQSEYLSIWERGHWLAQDGTWIDDDCRFIGPDGMERLPPNSVSFHVWTAYSPQKSWPAIARDWFNAIEQAKVGNSTEMQTFINTTLGQTYEEKHDKLNEHELKQRGDAYPTGVAPLGVLALVAGVDVQDDRFEVGVWGFGRGMQSWIVDYRVIYADPAADADWEFLDEYLAKAFPSAVEGASLALSAVAIDTGGHHTHSVYNFCRARHARRVFAIKGDNKAGSPISGKSSLIDVNWKGRVIKRGVRLHFVGTDTAKDLLFGRIRIRKVGPGYVHLTSQLPDTFFNGLTAEERVLRRTARGLEYAWVPVRDRNEPLDTAVYSLFAAAKIGLDTATEGRWENFEKKLEASIAVAPAPIAPIPATQPMTKILQPARPGRGSWVRGYRP